jgi:hypothetical protein
VLRWLLVALFWFAPLVAHAAPRPLDIARTNSDQAKIVEIVSQKISPDGGDLAIVLKPSTKRFSVDLKFNGRQFQRVKVTIRGVKRLEIARYLTDINREKASIDLIHEPEVRISQVGDDTLIDFVTPRAAHLLPPDGRLLLKDGDSDDDKSSP